MKNALASIAGWLLSRYYVGRTAYRLDTSGIATEGKFTEAGMRPGTRSFVLKFVASNQSVTRTIDINDIRFDRKLGTWIFND